MSEFKKTILIFTENRKEETNLVNYFRASDYNIKVAKEMNDFRHYTGRNILSFVLVDESVEKYAKEILKVLETIKVEYLFTGENPSPIFKNFVKKPFSLQSLSSLIEEKTDIKFSFDSKKVEALLEASKYVPIKIDDIYNLPKAPYDLFVKINEDKYVRIAKEGSGFAKTTLNNIISKGVHIIYASKDQYNKYLNMLTNTAMNMKEINVSKETKLNFLSKTSALIMDHIYNEGISKEMFFGSKQVLDSAMEIAMEDDNMFNMLNLLNDIDQDLYKHSLAMSIYSVLIAKNLDWEAEGTIFKLSLGALFADIGIRGIDPEILKKANTWLSEEESKEYEKHPLLGAEIMRNSVDSQDILDIVAQHHENLDGTGYPKKLTRYAIHPMAKIVRVAHEFCEQALKTESNPSPESPVSIIKRLYISCGKKLDLTLIEALAKAHGMTKSEIMLAS